MYASIIEITALHVECYLADVTFYVPTFFFFAGEFRIAGIYPIFADVTTDLFTAAAVELVNEGVWEPDFKSKALHIKLASFFLSVHCLVIDSGRTMVCQYYFVQSSDVQETLRVYDTIRDLNTVRLSELLTFNFLTSLLYHS